MIKKPTNCCFPTIGRDGNSKSAVNMIIESLVMQGSFFRSALVVICRET
jgi:hypothetical protein